MERVLVVPTEEILAPLRPPRDRFHPGLARELLGIVAAKGFFAARAEAEEEPRWKQIIPYGIVVSRAEVFLLQRTCKGGEARLHDKVSLGVGGHVNPADAPEGSLRAAVGRAFARELREELSIEGRYRTEVAGVLNDDSNPVGRVHLGIVYRVEVDEPRVRVREADRLSGGFVPALAVSAYRDRMETWSRVLQEHFWPETCKAREP